MKKLLVLCLSTCLSSVAFADKDACEDTVDMADSLDFSKLHVECSDDPVTIYDPKSKGSFLTKSGKAVTTYDKKTQTKASAVATQSVTSAAVSATAPAQTKTEIQQDVADLNNAGVLFNIREPFTITGGPQSALNGLFVQMAQYCEQGWSKEKEWVEPAESGYYLHYQFRCAE